jgi:sulfide:quinone oxidoreductase
MKKLVILGHGTGGTIIAYKMREKLPEKEWRLLSLTGIGNTIINLVAFIPFGIYTGRLGQAQKVPSGVNFVWRIEIDPWQTVRLSGILHYDWLQATGCHIRPDEVEGM